MVRAQCLCGDVVWEVEPPLQFVHDCHCTRCQKSTGVASATMAAVPAKDLHWLQGRAGLARYATSTGSERVFCPRCGSGAPAGDFGGLVFFPIGPLEGDFEAVSDGHIFVASKAPWHDITDGLPVFDAFPPGVEAPVLEDLPRAAAAPGRTGGSCLCGEVRWETEGKPVLMRRCYCLRCRRARQASHAANALFAREKLQWTGGREQVVVFELPGAERFRQGFCSGCGGKVPWYLEARDAWVVPLGALDDDPGARPSEHIFVASKPHWLEITDELPQYAEYPD